MFIFTSRLSEFKQTMYKIRVYESQKPIQTKTVYPTTGKFQLNFGNEIFEEKKNASLNSSYICRVLINEQHAKLWIRTIKISNEIFQIENDFIIFKF